MAERKTASDERSRRRLRRARLVLLVGLALWTLAGLAGAYLFGGHLLKRWDARRLETPVVAIESDDWGGGYYAGYLTGEEAFRQRLDAEQAEALERLGSVMKRHNDSVGRHPVITGMVVVAQADVPAILADPQRRYHWKPIDESLPLLTAAMRTAEADGTFAAQYHARDHKNKDRWTRALVAAAAAAEARGEALTPEAVHALWPEDEGLRRAMMTEYQREEGGRLVALPDDEIKAKLGDGLAVFRRLFGRDPVCTVAPKYLWDLQTELAWRDVGLKYVHGANWQLGPGRPPDAWMRELGTPSASGMLYVPRTVDMGVGVGGGMSGVAEVYDAVRLAFRRGQPAVISTHSWCYGLLGGKTAGEMAHRLDKLLTRIETDWPDVRYLTSEELGRLAEDGRVRPAGPAGAAGDVSVAGGMTHALLYGGALILDHLKVRIWVYGFLALLMSSIGVLALTWARRAPRKRREAKA